MTTPKRTTPKIPADVRQAAEKVVELTPAEAMRATPGTQGTITAALLERRGWRAVRVVQTDGREIRTLYVRREPVDTTAEAAEIKRLRAADTAQRMAAVGRYRERVMGALS